MRRITDKVARTKLEDVLVIRLKFIPSSFEVAKFTARGNVTHFVDAAVLESGHDASAKVSTDDVLALGSNPIYAVRHERQEFVIPVEKTIDYSLRAKPSISTSYSVRIRKKARYAIFYEPFEQEVCPRCTCQECDRNIT